MDKILKLFSQRERWEYAIKRGLDKKIDKVEIEKLSDSRYRAWLIKRIERGEYYISPPHTALIPKDNPNEFREVVVNEPVDRVILSILNDLLFELCPEMIHKNCKSYQKGIGCGQVVIGISEHIKDFGNRCIGFKADLSKYFDSVPIEYIDDAFDRVEEKHGKSALISMIREYYHNDWYFDNQDKDEYGRPKVKQKYRSLKQGCAVASWLANVILYHIDEELTQMSWEYKRYSDDIGCFSDDPQKCLGHLKRALNKMGLDLNPKKVELLYADHHFKFLGFSICGGTRSMSKSRLKKFQKAVEDATFNNRKRTPKQALNAINNALYKGNGEFSWATQVLPVINDMTDLNTMNSFIMDAWRAVVTGKHRIGGLGYEPQKEHCITRGKGRNVKANREKTGDQIDGYLSLRCMWNAIHTRRGVYDTLVLNL